MNWSNFKANGLYLLLSLFTLSSCKQSGGEFAELIIQLEQLPAPAAESVIDSLLRHTPNFPFVEDGITAHFLYRGDVTTVATAGDANGWDPTASRFARIANTDLWHFSANYPANARLEYKLVVDDTVWVLDPLNDHQVIGGLGMNSELRMPDYVKPPESGYYAQFPSGSIVDTIFYSEILATSRLIKIYLPPGYADSDMHYPLALFHDGHQYLELAFADGILDRLIAQEKIVPLIGVFVPPVDRSAEYTGAKKAAYGRFLVDELLPWIEARFRTRTNRGSRAVIGVSNGGNIALWLGVNYPQIFGMIAAQSSNVEESIAQAYSSGPRQDIQLYMDLGQYDIPLLLPRVKNLIKILEEQDYAFSFAEYPEGHNWRFWQSHLPDILVQFFPAK